MNAVGTEWIKPGLPINAVGTEWITPRLGRVLEIINQLEISYQLVLCRVY